MKKFFILLFFVCTAFAPGMVLAQEVTDEMGDLMPEAPESTPAAQVTEEEADYVLPYPGLLPDHPLYFLKTTRDRVVGWLISDPLKKAEFNLLQADKRLQAGIILVEQDKKKFNLALETVSKGENYFEQALANIEEADKQGMETAGMKDTLRKAVRKHISLAAQLHEESPKDQKTGFADIVKRVRGFEQKIMKMSVEEEK